MGLSYAELELTNPRFPEIPAVKVRALADTGTMLLCVPERMVRRLDLEQIEERVVTVADGRRLSVPYVGPILVRFGNRRAFAGALVLGDEVVMGAVQMEDMDLVVSPATRQVTVNPASPDAPTVRA